MTERAKQLKNTLDSLINDLDDVYNQILMSVKVTRVKTKFTWHYDLAKLFVIIKKYLYAIESERALNGYMLLLRKEVKSNYENPDNYNYNLKNLKKLKNTKTKSFNWFYYLLFKEQARIINAISPAMVKTLTTNDIEHFRKALINNNFDEQIKDYKDNEKEIKELKIDELFKPHIYKKFLLDFHKSVVNWLDMYITANELADDHIIKDPAADKWEDIKITFRNHCDVTIIINGKEENSNYNKLGFADNRKDTPDNVAYVKSWKILILFATQNGKITSTGYSGKQKDLFNKDRLGLSSKLKSYFGLIDNPIIYNESKQEYQILIKLTPAPEFRESWHDRNIFESNKKTFLGNY